MHKNKYLQHPGHANAACKNTHTHARTHARTYVRTHARKHARKHARADAHTHRLPARKWHLHKKQVTQLTHIVYFDF